MEGVRVTEARGPTTCGFCHDELDADAVLCPECGAGLHRDCREALGRCPTLGCAGLARVEPFLAPGEPPRSAPRRDLSELWRGELPPRSVAAVLAFVGFLSALALTAAISEGSAACIEVALVVLWGPLVAIWLGAKARIERARSLLEVNDPGRVQAVPVSGERGWELEVRFYRSTARPVDAHLAVRSEVPRWLVQLGPRVPLRLHGELRPGALVVLEGPRGQLLAANVISSREPRPPLRWQS